jgi:S-adenosylmethionine hydrolase
MAGIITLTTDFGLSDAYVAVMKGVILSTNPGANITDVTHSIEPGNIRQAAFILNTAYRHFPKQTVHVAIVDPGVGSERQGIILKTPSALFVAPDNGILSYVIDDLCPRQGHYEGHLAQYAEPLETVTLMKGLEAVAITDPRFWRHPVSATFHGRDIFAPVAAGLSLGISPYEFGDKSYYLHVFPVSQQILDSRGDLTGQIVHVDHFGSLITDIKSSYLPHRDIIVQAGGKYIEGLSRYYDEGEGLMAIIGSSGYLEISLKNGRASEFLSMTLGDEITVVLRNSND